MTHSPTTPPALSWDIFCRVVDNFGDVGVCWRLAQQIASERGEIVRLWVDDLATLAAFLPDLNTGLDAPPQTRSGVVLRHLAAEQAFESPHAVVIEAFGCGLPPAWLEGMASLPRPPLWVNLEYLSAEDWVAGCHGLPSFHPRLPLTLHFFFPGFSDDTGGLLREQQLVAQQTALQRDQPRCQQFLSRFGYQAEEGMPISLFCYDNSALAPLLRHWQSATPRTLLVADGLPRRQIAHYLQEAFSIGSRAKVGALTLIALPFLSQADYDSLLAACQINFVRGEDSLVRAQWAGRPNVWHIYPTADGAHFIKLDAFLARQTAKGTTAGAQALHDFSLAWNQGDGEQIGAHWQALEQALPALDTHAQQWRAQLAAQPDLLSKLVAFLAAKQRP